jgi:uncharacterized protein (DUF885 family)
MPRFLVLATGLILGVMPAAPAPATPAAFSFEDWKTEVADESSVDRLAEMYLELLLETDPTNGLWLGIHGKDADPGYYDDRLADVSADAIEETLAALMVLGLRLQAIDPDGLSPAARVDRHILQKQVELQMLGLEELGNPTDPLTYVSGIGGAFNGLVMRDYAPLKQRVRSFGRRCAAVPDYLEQARAMLAPEDVRPTSVQKDMAVARLRGMAAEGGLFDKTYGQLLDRTELTEMEATDLREACAEAMKQIGLFADWFEAEVEPRPDSDWRLGKTLYGRKYDLYLDYPLGPDALLAEAEKALDRVHGNLVATARRIHDGYLADAIEAGDLQPADQLSDQAVVANIFARLSEDRSTTETLIADSYALADTIVGFVSDKDLLDLPPTSKLRIEEIPPYLSGYAVAQIMTAPPFEPELESVWFWDLDLLSTSESYLKEYNRATLAMVYIHEGVPGHFVQLEYSNRFERIVPKVFYNGAMVEGWATYIATQLVDQGFTIYPDSPYGHDLQKMVDDKLVLRSIINAIIDIRLHTSDWPEEEAVRLMTERGFQEEGEAQGKLTRAKLSSVQLASYFAGHRAILELLAEYRAREGDDFTWKAFNERLVGMGSPPFFALREAMLAGADDQPR